MTETAILETRLAEVDAALHTLRTGVGVASFKYDGREVSYTKADISDLKVYKRELEEQLGLVSKRRSMRVNFR